MGTMDPNIAPYDEQERNYGPFCAWISQNHKKYLKNKAFWMIVKEATFLARFID